MKTFLNLLRNNFYYLLFAFLTLLFFYPVFLSGKIPIPADTIVGMYHPWRDKVWDDYTSGVPYKNYLITDPVRQQYVWRKLAIDNIKSGNLPLWNPYSFSGTALLANFQTAAFYPLNILYFIMPFNLVWTVQIILQPLLAGIFLYLYLRFIKISKAGSFIGGFAFSFSGFSIAWLEWNSMLQTVLWLPLSLLSIEKLTYLLNSFSNSKFKIQNSKLKLKNKKLITWLIIFTFSLSASFLAGHLQLFLYSLLIIFTYLLGKVLFNSKHRLKILLLFFICFMLFVLVTAIQWIPTVKFILQSAREIDQSGILQEGWYIPWQNLIQFISPDFFGNPATGNYWGVWNYGEFIGYIGTIPLILSLYALLFRQDKKVLFFGILLFSGLLFALPTPLAKLPYSLNIPLISTSQPTRLIYVIDFALGILAAMGMDQFLRDKNRKKLVSIILSVGVLFLALWTYLFISYFFKLSLSNDLLNIARRNLILPTLYYILSSSILIFIINSRKKWGKAGLGILILFLTYELFRFGWKFTPFSKSSWVFPETEIISYIKENIGNHRILTLDRRIMPPNFAANYKLQDVAGYDPLYLHDYNQLVGAWERNKPDISSSSFNRIVTPSNYDNFLTNLMGIKYILSYGSLDKPLLKQVMNEGNTNLYLNPEVFPRAFFVQKLIQVSNKQNEIEMMYQLKNDLRIVAVTTEALTIDENPLIESDRVEIIRYEDNKIELKTTSDYERLMILTDVFYPSWQVKIDGNLDKIHRVDFNLRGVKIPAGEHTVEFIINIL